MDQWSDFPDAGTDEPKKKVADDWSDFPDAPKSGRAKGRKPKAKEGESEDEPDLSSDAIVNPIDGDTYALRSGRDVRIWGIDAPELRQQGWDRQGQPVPIGIQARDALADITVPRNALLGDPVGYSWGRPVAPVSMGGNDVGNDMLRAGHALAAPGFMQDDPARSFQYMQAERLARQNALGVHDTYHQSPEEFRKDPEGVVPRETIAGFWDTPTPNAGMRPEVERQFQAMLNDHSIAPEAISEWVKANGGFVVDPSEIREGREAAAKSGQSIGMHYTEQPQILTDLGDGVTGATIRAGGTGFVAGGLDELGAVVDAFGGTDGRENIWNSDRRLADIWANNQAQNSSILGHDEFAHPMATTIGELSGALASGFVIPYGAGARTVPQLATVGGIYGGLEGFLGTDGDLAQRSIGAAKGAPIGAAVNAVGGKAIEFASPYVGRLIERFTGRGAPEHPPGTPGTPAGTPGPDNKSLNLNEEHLPHPEHRETGVASTTDEWSDFPDAMAMEAEPHPAVTAELPRSDAGQPQRMDQPLTEAQRKAIAQNVEPRDVLPIPANEIADVEEAIAADAGRTVPAKPGDERAELQRRTVKNVMGQDVPKVGPIDLIGWARLQGGLNDAGDAVSKGGDLKAMGFTNASRKGLDFVGQEHRFGPLVSDTGMSLDDAAERAWETGYFTERPTVNEFLDALRGTYDGNNRRFLPEDLGEIERFEGAQADRIDLEKRIAEEGPIYDDRSVPASEPAPLPPVEAYEEWPSGGPDFAGNINLKKLESPQDISRALTMTEKRVGFDAATRGRVSQAETERLAAELNLTPEKLLERRNGQAFNAEEALAARQILAKSGNELVNMARKVRSMEEPGDDVLADFRQAWMRHVAIQEQVSGMTAEAGRALAQFKAAANARAVHGNVLSALVKGGGGRDNLKDVAGQLLEAAETTPDTFNVLASKLTKPKWHSRASELYINFLLSGPQTHVVNMTSNTLTAMAQIPEHILASGIGKMRQGFTNAQINRITASEVGARTFGLLQGAKEGARLFAHALKTGEASDFVAKVEGDEFKAIPGKLGEVIRVPTRLLTAEDELFKGIARRMEINGQAVRIANREGLKGSKAQARIAELVADPTDEMLDRADDYGRYLTFQRPLGTFASKISAMTNDPSGWGLAAKTFLPFVRTPANLLKFAAERSPAAPMMKEWREDFRAGGVRRDLAAARAMIGTGIGALVYEAAANGLITGSAPTDAKKARLLYADGWKPYSLKVDDTYYSYKRLDPFSTTLGVAADMATLPEGMSERQQEDKATLLVASIMGNLASKTWLSGISQLTEAVREPDRYADNMLQKLVGAFLIPNVIASTARALDPTQRDVETMGDAMKSRIPGLRDDLLPRRDIWGREIVSEGGIGPDFLSPVWVSKALNDPVNHELMQLDYAPQIAPKKIGSRELTPKEHDRYQELSGKKAHADLTKLVKSAEWHVMDDEAKVKAARKTVTAAREDAKAKLFENAKGNVADDGDDEWSGFETAGKAKPKDDWSGFTDVPQRDVIGGLEKAIPGIRFTSGYRSADYNESLRARGYHPAKNSAHIDGSGIDMLPPPGKSLSWLQEQVRKVEPDARFLIHDGHLHATIPGWYGAPLIGGAKAAGY